MTGFERPAALLLFLLPPIAALLKILFPEAAARAFPSASPRGIFSWNRGPRAWANRISAALFWLAFSALVLALAGPGAGMKRRLFLSRGPDIVFAIDVSPSMAARHGRGSRLDASLALVRDLASSGGNASLGIIAFASEMALVSPATEDRGYLLSRAETLKPGMLGEGTDLGLGMAGALYHLDGSSAPARLAVLITDGEENLRSVSPSRAAELFRRSGISLMVLGIGQPGETGLSYEDPETGRITEGVYVSGFDEGRLEALAREAGGEFFLADSAETLPRVRAELLGSAAPSGASREESGGSELALPLAGLALLLMALSRLIALLTGAPE